MTNAEYNQREIRREEQAHRLTPAARGLWEERPDANPLTPDDYRMWALHYAAMLIKQGYTVERAEIEDWSRGGPGEPGFGIKNGLMLVGLAQWRWSDKKLPGRFRFAELVETIENLKRAANPQMELELV